MESNCQLNRQQRQRMDEAIAFEVAIVEEDLFVQSRYETLNLPLDVTAELHTRADKFQRGFGAKPAPGGKKNHFLYGT
jgi:hypothetical protein